MRPKNLKTKIFLDSGNPVETKEAIKLLGFLDGQTTNPSLVAKNPEVSARLGLNQKFTKAEIDNFYREIVVTIAELIPQGSVSIEVYADPETSADDMVVEGQKMFAWIPNAHIKFPATRSGLIAAQESLLRNLRVNLTLCFSEAQAAAVYGATRSGSGSALPGFKNVFISPFVGRLDDRGENGMDLIKNITAMYKKGDQHVAVLAASIRSIDHFLYAIALGTDIITAPLSVLRQWSDQHCLIPDESYVYPVGNLTPIPYKNLDPDADWQTFDIGHDLVDSGVRQFAADWNKLII